MDRYPPHSVVDVDGNKKIIDPDGEGTVYLLSDKELTEAELDL